MATLTGNSISNTYISLLKVSDNGELAASLQSITDGAGNASGLSMNTGGDLTATGTVTANAFVGALTGNVTGNITGNVTGDLTGNVTATSVLANGVTATTQTIGDNSTKVATTAYVDAAITAEDLDFQGDTGTGSVDLDTQSFTIAGGTGLDSVASDQTLTLNIDSTVATLTGTQTLTNKSIDLTNNTFTGTLAEFNTALSDNNFASLTGAETLTNKTVDLTSNTLSGTLAEFNTALSDATFTSLTGAETLTNKTIDVDNNTISNLEVDNLKAGVLDTDLTSVSASDDTLASAKAIKTYVDSNITAQDLDITDGTTTSAVDLDSQTLTIQGTSNEVEVDLTGQTFTVGLPSSITANVVGDLTGNADTATALQTARTINLGGDLSGSASFNGTSDITISATIGANSVALGTDTTGDYVASLGTGTGVTIGSNTGEGSNPTIAVDYGSTANTSVQGNTNFTLSGTTNEIEITGTSAQALGGGPSYTIGLPDNVTIAGDLTVNGTTTTINTQTLSVEDPLIEMANQNAANTVDTGFYANYSLDAGVTTKYAGLFKDASDSDTFKLFKGLEVEPTTSVDTAGTGYTKGDLVVNDLDAVTISGNLTGSVLTAAQTNITSVGTLSSLTVGGAVNVNNANINLSNAYNLTGRNNADTLNISLIGRNTSDNVVIDADGYGTKIGSQGLLTVTSTSVGIGTSSPGAKLDISFSGGGDSIKSASTSSTSYNSSKFYNDNSKGWHNLVYGSAYSGGSLLNIGADGAIIYGNTTSGITTLGAFDLLFGTNNTERMRIDTSGRVGIGTSSINSKVQIEQPQQISGAFSNPFIKLSNSAQTDNTGTTAIALATSTADNYGYAISAKRGTSGADSSFIITHHDNSLAGTERMRIDSSGNVISGYGTTSGNYHFTGSTYKIEGGNNFGDLRFTAPRYRFYEEANLVMTIDDSKVGIGTTSPRSVLEAKGDISIFDDANVLADEDVLKGIHFYTDDFSYNPPAGRLNTPISKIVPVCESSGGDQFGLSLYTAAQDAESTERMRIDSSGNVGIGTSSPLNYLHLSGSNPLTANIVLGNAYAQFGIYNSGNQYGIQQFVTGSGNGHIQVGRIDGSATAYNLILQELGGNVGIGTDSPRTGYKLDVQEATDNGVNIQAGNATTDIALSVGSASTSDKFVVQSGGNVGIGTTSPSYPLHVYNATIDTVARFESGDASVYLSLKASDNTAALATSGTDFLVINDGSGNLRFFNNSSERMRIDSSGRVGIGTTSPSSDLHIADSFPRITLQDTDGSSTLAYISYSGDFLELTSRNGSSHGNIRFRRYDGTSTVDSMYIDSSGNVGIGTTTPNYLLDVEGSGSLLRVNSTSGDSFVQLSVPDTTSITGVNFGDSGSSFAGYIRYRHNGDSMAFATAGSEAMRIDSSGNVGIGKTPSSEKLEVNGAIVWQGALITSQTSAGVLDRSGDDLRIRVYGATAGSGNFVVRTGGGGGSADSEAMRITSAGDVGIGTDSPDSTGYVNLETAKNIRINTGNAGADPVLYFSHDNFASATSNYITVNRADESMRFNVNDSERMRITSAGNVIVGKTTDDDNTTGVRLAEFGVLSASRTSNVALILNRTGTDGSIAYFRNDNSQAGDISVSGTTTSYNTSSDYRLKEDTKNFDGLAMLNDINVYDFKWKESDKRSYGVFAHELQEVLPQAVNGEKDAEEMQSVDYSKIVPVLVKAIQQQQEEINNLKQQINK